MKWLATVAAEEAVVIAVEAEADVADVEAEGSRAQMLHRWVEAVVGKFALVNDQQRAEPTVRHPSQLLWCLRFASHCMPKNRTKQHYGVPRTESRKRVWGIHSEIDFFCSYFTILH